MKSEVSGVQDKLTVKVQRICKLEDQCPAVLCRKGAVYERVIRAGDTVRFAQDDTQVYTVDAVTTDYGPHLGRFSIRGESRRLAAAMLLLTNGATKYVDDTVEKICPHCNSPIVNFNV